MLFNGFLRVFTMGKKEKKAGSGSPDPAKVSLNIEIG